MTRQGGDTIEDAFEITSMPYISSGTTEGYTHDYDEVCPYGGSTAPDVVYKYTATADQWMDVDMQLSSYDTKIYIYEDGLGNLVACNDDYYSDYTSAIWNAEVFAGHTYYIVIDGYGLSAGLYQIAVSVEDPPAPFECPPGSIAGLEVCGELTNDGCNMPLPAVEYLSCGDTVCATAFADDNLRDTDWYSVTLENDGWITLTGTAQFPFYLGFVEFTTPGAP